jgi:hypothetical protein
MKIHREMLKQLKALVEINRFQLFFGLRLKDSIMYNNLVRL